MRLVLGSLLARCLALGAPLALLPLACGGGSFSGPTDAGGSNALVEGGTLAEGGHDGSPSDGDPGGPKTDGPMPAVEAGATIEGTVVDAFLVPIAGATVSAQGVTTTTDSKGQFTLQDIVRPYSPVVAFDGSGSKHAYVFALESRVDPTFQLLNDVAAAPRTATITGLTPLTASGVVFADLPPTAPAAGANSTAITLVTTTYSLTPAWMGDTSVGATLYSLQWVASTSTGMPTSYQGYNSETATLTAGQTTTWNPLAGTTPSSGALSVTATSSTGYVLADVSLYVRPPGAVTAGPIVHANKSPTSPVTFVTPALSNTTFVACAAQGTVGTPPPYGVACRAGLGPSDNPQIQMPTAPTLISPPQTVGAGTQVSWNAMSNAVHLLSLEPASGTVGPSIYVMTAGNFVRVPGGATLGFGLTPGAHYKMSVYGFVPFGNIDDATSPGGYGAVAVALRNDQGPPSDGALGFGGTAPVTVQ